MILRTYKIIQINTKVFTDYTDRIYETREGKKMVKVIKNQKDLNEYLHQIYLQNQGDNKVEQDTVKIETPLRPAFSSDEVTERAQNLDLSLRRGA
jgi:hypothetical protein